MPVFKVSSIFRWRATRSIMVSNIIQYHTQLLTIRRKEEYNSTTFMQEKSINIKRQIPPIFNSCSKKEMKYVNQMRRRGGDRVYEVQQILDEKVIDYEMHYLIKWKNLDHGYDTWEPISGLANIQKYLKTWLIKRKEREMQRERSSKSGNFKCIKEFLPTGSFLSKKKIRNSKYAEEILSKPKTWQKYYSKVEQYITIDEESSEEEPICGNFMQNNEEIMQDEGIINNNNGANQGGNKQQQQMDIEYCANPPQNDPQKQAKFSGPLWEQRKRHKQPQQPKLTEQPLIKNAPVSTPVPASAKNKKIKKERSEKQNRRQYQFNVVGHIDMHRIDKILRGLAAGGTKLLQIRMPNGKCHFVREDDVRKINPGKLMEFYQDEGIDF